jgi:hypothetical protein
VLLAAQAQHLQRRRAPLVHSARQAIEFLDLPAVRLGDAAPGPQQNLLLTPELDHRLTDPYELVGCAEITAKQCDDRPLVAVEHREALACPAHRKEPLSVVAFFDRATVASSPRSPSAPAYRTGSTWKKSWSSQLKRTIHAASFTGSATPASHASAWTSSSSRVRSTIVPLEHRRA